MTLEEFKSLNNIELEEVWEREVELDEDGADGNGLSITDILNKPRKEAYYYIFE